MANFLYIYALLILVSGTVCDGQKSYYPIEPETKQVTTTSHGPLSITRNIKQDKKGNIWIAAFDGVFRYDPSALLKIGGKAFTNITSPVSSARFFDVLEDKKGNFWFSSIGSGVFYYDPSKSGKDAFQHFTTKEGLANDRVPHIYQDKSGRIWFGTESGASRFDPSASGGKSFQNYLMNGGLPNGNKDDNDVNSILEDKTGKFWFATRGNLFTYDGKKFTVFTHNGDPFINVRTIMEDKKGNIWLAGAPGLWRVNGSTFTNFTLNFTGYVYEDRKGNIWTSSKPEYSYNGGDRWVLSRYDAKTLLNPKPTATDIMEGYEDYKNMLFGILEANDGSIWFGSLGGVYRYDGKNIVGFKDK
jgi:ligand-binding sensor domain-containing protein